jgi:thioredoxin 1
LGDSQLVGKNFINKSVNLSHTKIFKTLSSKGFQGWPGSLKKILARRLAISPDKINHMNKAIGKKEFKSHVVESITLSLVQFKTEWNGACQIVSMIYDDLANAYRGAANFFTVDVEEEAHLGKEYGIIEIPTILFFKSGQVIDYATGLTPKNVLISKIENALSTSKN